MKIKLLIIALITTMCLFAQTPQDSIVKLDEIVVNGIRSGKTTPVTEKTITRSEIQKTYQGYEVSSILSNKTPNVTTSSDNGTQFGYTYFRIRGIDQTRINMTLNGVPLNEPEDQGVFFSNYPNFTDNIQSMEVQRGVGTSSNGVSSFAGSINFNSPSGFDKETSIKYTVGDFNTVRLSTTYSSGLNSKKMALYVNGSTYSTDGYRYNSGGNGTSLFISGGYFGDKNKLKFTGFTGNSKNGMSWMAVSESDINNDQRTNYNKDDGWDNFTQTFTQLEYTNKVSANSLLSSSVFYNRLNGGYDYLTPQFGGGNRNLFLASNFYGVVTNLNYKGEKLKVDFGISGNIYNREHSYTFLETNKGFKNELSSYLKLNRNVNKMVFSLDLQQRFVQFDYKGDVSLSVQKWSFFNPKIGFMYNFTNKTNLYATVGKSNREPTRTNMFSGLDWLETFNDIKPESVIDYEFGLNHVSDELSLQTNLFYMDFTNEIALIGGVSPSGVPLTSSVDNSFRTGLEIDLKYKVFKSFSIIWNEAITYSEINNNGETFEPILTPKLIRNLGLSFNKDKFFVELMSKTHSESYIDLENKNKTPRFTIFNANLGLNIDKVLSVVLSVNNITNVKYYTNGNMVNPDFSPATERHFFANPKRNMFITFKFTL